MQDKPIHASHAVRYLAAAAFMVAPLGVAQAQQTLKIHRGADGAVLQEIAVSSATYSSKLRQLIVNTTNGDRVCGAAQSKAAGAAGTLVLDGRNYALQDHDFSSSSKVINVAPQHGVGLFPLCVNQAAAKGGDPIKLSVNVAANADVGGPSGRASVNTVNSTVAYTLSDGRLTLPLAEDVLCMNVGSGSGDPVLNLVDTNGVETQFTGISDLAFYPFSGPFGTNSLVLNTSSDLVCVGLSDIGAKRVEKFDQECQLVDLPAPIFYGGFGDDRVDPPPQLAPGIDLQVNVELDQNPTLPAPLGTDEQAVYRVQVKNCGRATASSVSVRDFWRPVNSATNARFASTSGWTCAACQSGAGNGTGYIAAEQQTLASQQEIEFVATRPLSGQGTVFENEAIELAVVAFAGPGSEAEFAAADNTTMFNIPVLSTNNTPPTISLNGTPDILDERDGNPPQLIELIGLLTASDEDEGELGEIVDANVSYSDPQLFSAAGSLVKNGGEITLTLRPISDANGIATISVTAVDGGGAESAPVNFDIELKPVNDAPTFTAHQFDASMPGYVDTSLPECQPGAGTGCANQVWNLGSIPQGGNISMPNWVASQSVGPANESIQTMSYIVDVISGSDLFINSFFEPQVDENGALEYGLKTGDDAVGGVAVIEVTAMDSGSTSRGGVNVSQTLQFAITVQ